MTFTHHLTKPVKKVMPYILQSIIISSVLFINLDIGKRSLEIPFVFSGDAFHFLMATKSIIQSGWWWDITRLSAPYGLPLVAFPVNGNFDFLIIKLFTVLSNKPGFVLNLYWLFTVILTGITCTWSLKKLGISSSIAFTIGILYALLPHAFFRNISHLMLVYYMVPIISALAIKIASDNFDKLDKKDRFIFYFACVVVGFSYIYTAFFSILVLFGAGIISLIVYRKRNNSLIAIGAIAIIAVSTIINIAPTFYFFRKHPETKQMMTTFKPPSDSEIYGLKLRHLVMPVPNHKVNIFQKYNDITKKFPLENENRSACIGIIASIGFFTLLIGSLYSPKAYSDKHFFLAKLYPASSLNMFIFLFATIGGLGSIFNLLISPQIRCYNRMSVFIAFFSLYATSIILSAIKSWIENKNKWFFYVILVILLIIGIIDQNVSYVLSDRYQNDRNEYNDVKSLVNSIEGKIPKQGMVYQLPYTPYPATPPMHRMTSHQHLAVYVLSNTIRLSWPAISEDAVKLNNLLNGLNTTELIQRLVVIGFDGIWLDCYGYEDNGDNIIKQITKTVDIPPITSSTGRYIYIDLSKEKKRLTNELRETELKELYFELLHPEQIKYYRWNNLISFSDKENASRYIVSGWSGQEKSFRWTEKTNAKMRLKIMPTKKDVQLIADITPLVGQQLEKQEVKVYVNGSLITEWIIQQRGMFKAVISSTALKNKDEINLEFFIPNATSPKSLGINEDERILGLAFWSLQLQEIENTIKQLL